MATIDTDAPKSNAVLSASNLYRKQRTLEVDPFDTINDPSVPEVDPFDTIDPNYVSEEEAAEVVAEAVAEGETEAKTEEA